MLAQNKSRKWIYLADQLAKYIVQFAGTVIILSVVAIFLFIGLEAVPLFRPAKLGTTSTLDVSSDLPLEIGIFEPLAFLILPNGTIDFFSLSSGEKIDSKTLGLKPSCASYNSSDGLISIGTIDGQISLAEIDFRKDFSQSDQGQLVYQISEQQTFTFGKTQQALSKILVEKNDYGQLVMVALTDKGNLLLSWYDMEMESQGVYDLTNQIRTAPTEIALNDSGEDLLIGSINGLVYHFDLSDLEQPDLAQVISPVDTSNKNRITALNFLLGGEAFISGNSTGVANQYSRLRPTGGTDQLQFHYMRSFNQALSSKRNNAITKIINSPRNKSFLLAETSGKIRLCFSTSNKEILWYGEHQTTIQSMNFSPKGNSVLSLDQENNLRYWRIDDKHPEISLQTLFGKVWYENYSQPEYVWQTTGSNDSESKFSITPLFFGTLKATFYAMLFSLPTAILGAFYTSQFASPKLRSTVKPIVELMASIPSVVIGFLAGLWLSPILEIFLLTTFLTILTLPLLVIVNTRCWDWYSGKYGMKTIADGIKGLAAIITIVVSILIAHLLAVQFERYFFAGDLTQWMMDTLRIRYDTRNSLVVGIALGIAVIPIIYTLVEDSLSNVPLSLVSAALALGASRVQAALWVVLPAASPGIFAAIMLGLGRAVGETMIVLMASGNAPIIDWSIFSSMRTMSAAIAIEIPEAPRGETLYRILFLIAGLLFILTFVINTCSDLVGSHLRKKYSRF